MSQFDPNTFLDAQITEPTQKRPPLPVGDYTAVIGEITARAWTGKKDPTKTGIAWDVTLTLEIPTNVQTELGFTKSTITMKDSVMLNMTPSGTIDNSPGANRQLRQYREAADLNKPGDAFSARALTGKVVLVKIGHELYQDEPVERIKGVAKLG